MNPNKNGRLYTQPSSNSGLSEIEVDNSGKVACEYTQTLTFARISGLALSSFYFPFYVGKNETSPYRGCKGDPSGPIKSQ